MVKDPSVFVKVKAADGDFSYLVWTTTPWTLPSNAALCMKDDADYVMVEHEGEKYVLAEALVWKTFGGEAAVEVLERYKGKDFAGRRYEPMFDTFKSEADKAFFVINGDFVTLDDGTGIVHIAPGYGADDYEVGKKHDLPVFAGGGAERPVQGIRHTVSGDVRQGRRPDYHKRPENLRQAVQKGIVRAQLSVLLAV